jgi:VCBS repeat-containing protein
MSTFQVNSVAGLTAALQTAHGGDTIQLAPGTYSRPVIANVSYSSAITITSADPSHQAVISGLGIDYVNGINFTNLQLTTIGSTDPIYAFRVADSSNLKFSNIHVGGDPSIVAYDQIAGFYITGSSNISLNNSTFEHMSAGIIANNDSNVQIINDAFAYLNKGGIEMGGTSNVSIANNSFTDFQTQSSVHPDAIQLYTQGMLSAASNVSITGNNIERGNGNAIQGIFVSDDTGGLMPFNNLTISDNTIVGGMWNSLYVASATGNVQINNNYVASWAGLDPEGGGTAADINSTPLVTGFAGYIWLQDIRVTTLSETGNTAQAYLGNGGGHLPTPAGNTLIGMVQAYAPSTPPVATVTAVAQNASAAVFGQTSGNLLTGDTGSGIYLASVAANGQQSQLVSANGTAFAGKYGTLTVSSDGSFTYNSNNFATTVGVAYDDQFAVTVGSSGQATSTTLDVLLTATGVGNGQVDYITGGSAASTISAFGTGSQLTSGIASDTFVFNNIGQSTLANETVILGLKAGDLIDLSGLGPNMKIVSQFDGHADEIVLAHMGTGNWQVQVDTTGAGAPNFAVHLLNTNVANLTAANFILSTAPAPVVTTPVVATPVVTAPVAATPTASQTSAAPTALSVTPDHLSSNSFGATSGNLLAGDSGTGLYLSAFGVGTDPTNKSVSATGTTFTGQYGTLTVSSNGAFTYNANAINAVVGVAYDDHFTMTVANSAGAAATTSLDVVVSSTGGGNGQADIITGGASASTISGFGTGSLLISGVGADTFVFNNIGQSTLANETYVNNFKAGDLIDLSGLGANLKVVSQFDGHAGEVFLAHMGNGNWQVEVDTTGAGVPDFAVHLLNDTVANLTAANLILSAPSGAVATVAAPAPAPTTTFAINPEQISSNSYGQMSGNLLNGESGTGIILTAFGVGTDPTNKAVSATGTTFTGHYGTLTVSSNGAYTYNANALDPVVGVAYDDHFTMTVANPTGASTTTSLDVILSSSGVGNGLTDYITGGAAASTISAFGTGSLLTSGLGAATFVFDNIGQSTLANETVIKNFKDGDIIDLSGISPNLKIVSQFDGHANEVFLAHMGNGNWQVQVDTTGAGVPDFAVHLLNDSVANLTAANFHL